MSSWTAKLRQLVADTSLRPAIAVALFLGLSLPIAITGSRDLTARRDSLLAQLAEEHARIVKVLAIGMRTPIWDVRPDTGQPMIDTLMQDERVAAIAVSATLMPDFLVAQADDRRQGRLLSREAPVMRDGEEIGGVRIEMSTAKLEAAIAERWAQVLTTGLLQLALGMLIIFPLLRFKVLTPVDRLVAQSGALAEGTLDQPLKWDRGDELGALGQSFEKTRQALLDLVRNLESRNRDLEERESELARKSGILRTTLDNMTDGINLIDENLRLVSWNDRLSEIMGIPREMFREGVPVADLVSHDLSRQDLSEHDRADTLEAWRATFHAGTSSRTRYRTAEGQDIDVRRRPMPGGGFVSTFTDVTEQLEANRKAEATLRLLETVMDAVPAVLHVKDRELRYQMVNREFLDAWKVERAAAIGRTNDELFEGEHARRADARDRRVIETRRPLPFYEGSRPGQNGQDLVTWTTKVPLLDADGEVSHILTVDLDITDRKRAEQEVERWLQLFEDAMESFPNGIAVFDASRRLLTCNSAYASLYDSPPAGLAGATIDELLPRLLTQLKSIEGRPPRELDLAPEDMFEALWKGQPREAQEIELKDGRWMLISRHPTAEGGYATIRTDITDLKRMENDLRDSEELVRSILEACSIPISMTRAGDGTFVYLSPAGEALFGPAVTDERPASARDQYVDLAQREEFISALREQGGVDAYELEFTRPDGSHFWSAVSGRLMDYKGEKVIVAACLDLTEQKALEEEKARQRDMLFQTEKINALGGLLAGVAHELNNPLSVVVGQALLLSETADDPKIKRRAERIGTAAERCSRIVKTFLAMARQSAPSRGQVDLNDVIESALEITGYTLRSANIEVLRELSEDLPPVWADADQLTQVLMNLIVNAEQAMADQLGARTLRISTRLAKTSQRVQLRVHDTGPGISPEDSSRVFEPFYTTKEFGVGTGIGLSVSYGIVQAHGGTLQVENASEGGAVFTVALPVSTHRSVRRRKTETPESRGHGCRVLAVDDEPEVTEMLAEILSTEGHEVVTAGSGNAAMRMLGDRDFDVILTDMRMPDVDGAGLYLRIKNAYPEMANRIVFITGDTLGPSNRSFLEQTGLPYLEKPIAPDEVRRMIREILKAQGVLEA